MDAQRSPRNHVIDAARAFSVFVVVVFHSLLYVVRAVDGRPELVPWAPPHWPWWPLSWFFMVIPIFFVAGGFAHALLVDRSRAEGTGYGHFLANRGRRLVGPLVFFVAVVSLVSSIAAWTGPPAMPIDLTRQLMQLLWFIAVYLVIVAIAPVAVSVQDTRGWWPWLVVIALAAVVDAVSFASGQVWVRNVNMLLVWPAVHSLGIAYHRGWLVRGPVWTPWAALLGGASAVVVLVFGFGYPGSSVGLADITYANVQPPTVAMVALAVAQCGLLALIERSGVLKRPPSGLVQAMSVVNALMMSVYLWHIGCIALAALALVALAQAAPAASGVLLAQPTVAALALLLVAAIVPHLGRLELRLIPPLGPHPRTDLAVVAFGTLVVGTGVVWLTGTVVHPASPVSSVGVGLVLAGYGLMRLAASGRRDGQTRESRGTR